MHANSNAPDCLAIDTERGEVTLSFNFGPGAPIFEPGPHTRIRRTPVRAIATLTWTGGPREIFGQVVNVGPGGCLIKTESTIAPGTEVEMTITVLGNDHRFKVDVTGEIRRETVCDGRRAYGVEFTPQNREDR